MADHGEAATEYSVDFGEGDQRTLSVQEIATEYAGGTITAETYVWTDGFADWKPLGEVAALFQAVTAPRAAKSSPWESRSSAGRAASRGSAGRAATADLFGGIDNAGGEDEVQTSAPQHDASSSTGSRNESSVLFSLSALTSQANQRPSTRPSAASSSSRDDSGLIDLKALTAAAMKSDAGAAAAPVAPAVPVSPFGVAPPLGGIAAPLGGVTATTDIGGGSKSRAPLYIGGGIAIGMIALAAAIVFRPVPPPPAPIVVAAPPPVVTQAPAPAPAPTEDAQPAATAGAAEPDAPGADKDKEDASTKKAAARASTRRPAATTAKKSEPAAAATPAPKPTAAPKKSGGGCGCASGDLQCAIRCAAK